MLSESGLSCILSNERIRRVSFLAARVPDSYFIGMGPNHSLRQLTLENIRIGPCAVEWLKNADQLRHLVIHDCSLDPSSANAIASMKSLRVLLARLIRVGVYKSENNTSKDLDDGFTRTMGLTEWSEIVQSNKNLVVFRNDP